MSSQRKRVGSTSTCKCKHCKRKEKHDDITAIGCEKCGNWFHGSYVSLTADEVSWMGKIKYCILICDNCLEVDIFKYEAKFCTIFNEATDLINNIKSTFLSPVECEIPRIIEKTLPAQLNENVVKAFIFNLPSYRDVLTNGTGKLRHHLPTYKKM